MLYLSMRSVSKSLGSTNDRYVVKNVRTKAGSEEEKTVEKKSSPGGRERILSLAGVFVIGQTFDELVKRSPSNDGNAVILLHAFFEFEIRTRVGRRESNATDKQK